MCPRLQAHQVDVCWQVFDNVALDAAADNPNVVMAFNLQVEQRRHELALTQACQQLVEVDLDRQWINTTTINDARYVAITASLAGGPPPRVSEPDEACPLGRFIPFGKGFVAD